MKKLTHEDLLKFPEASDYAKKEDEKALADYLVRILYGRNLSDFGFNEPFMIEASIATLTVTENDSELTSNVAPVESIVEMFKQTNVAQEKLKAMRESIARIKSPGIMEMTKNAMGAARRFVNGGFALTPESEYAHRKEICSSCEYWDSTVRMGMGKCLKCGCTSIKLRFATEKCPLHKWGTIDTEAKA